LQSWIVNSATVAATPAPDIPSHGVLLLLCLLLQVSVLAEGQSLPLTELSELISRSLSSGSSGSAKQGTDAPAEPLSTPVGTQDAAAAAAAPPAGTQHAAAGAGTPAAASDGSGSGPTALVVRNLIQEVASRKSYGLQDGKLQHERWPHPFWPPEQAWQICVRRA
jgi:hypothetical protein